MLSVLKSILLKLGLNGWLLNDVEQDNAIENMYESQEEINIRFIGSKKPNLSIGRGTYINGVDLYCWDNRINISIGRYCSIADTITIVAGGEHDIEWVSTYPFIPRWGIEELYYMQKPRFKGDIKIGNDVWISNNVVILSGVSISDGAVIGAGSIVTKDVPPYCIAVGNPAKIARKRFSDEIIDKLLNIKWWDWDKEKIYNSLPYYNDINEFIKRYEIK
jgi:acetyltransferase-like isoleucine patch superfamily enzyme